MPPKFVFLGRVLPAANPDTPLSELHPNDFTEEITRQLRLAHVPLYRIHDTSKAMGKILGNFQHSDGSQFVWGRVDDQELADEIRRGDLAQLSMTHFFQADFNPDGTEVQTRIPLEVSVAKEGNRPNCDIVHFFEIGHSEDQSKVNFTRLFENMATPAEPKAVVAETPAAEKPAESEAPATQEGGAADAQIDPENVTVESLIAAFKRDGLSDEQVLAELATIAINNHALKSKLQELEAKNAELQKLEQVATVHDDVLFDAYRQNFQETDVAFPPEAETQIRDMIRMFPQGFKTILANTSQLALSNHRTALEELKAHRELNRSARAKDPSPSTFSAREYLESARNLESRNHRTGSRAQGILSNSKVESEVRKVSNTGSSAIIQPPAAEVRQQKSAKEILAGLGIDV